MSRTARAVQMPGKAAGQQPQVDENQKATVEQAADAGAAAVEGEPGQPGDTTEPTELDILRQQLAAANQALADERAKNAAALVAAQPDPVPVAAQVVQPAEVVDHVAAQRATLTSRGWHVPAAYGSPVNRLR